MRTLEEIAREAANRVGNLPPSVEFNHVACGIILSALTEATRESEEQVAELREALKEIASYHPTRNVADLRCIAGDALKS